MPPSIIAIDTNNLNHVYSRQRLQSSTRSHSSSSGSSMMRIPAVIEVSTNRFAPKNGQIEKIQKNINKKKPKSLPVSIHIPLALTHCDTSFHSMDGLSSSYSLLRDQLRDKLEPRYRKLQNHVHGGTLKRQKLQKELKALKRRLRTIGNTKRVRFAAPVVTEVHTRPFTDIEDIPRLYFQEEELDQFEQDRCETVADVVECAFVEEAYAISVAYQRRTSVDE